MTDRLLTDDELVDLTGLEQPAAQRKWLEAEGIHYFPRRDGKPRTTWHLVNHPSGMKRGSNDEPNFGALANG